MTNHTSRNRKSITEHPRRQIRGVSDIFSTTLFICAYLAADIFFSSATTETASEKTPKFSGPHFSIPFSLTRSVWQLPESAEVCVGLPGEAMSETLPRQERTIPSRHHHTIESSITHDFTTHSHTDSLTWVHNHPHDRHDHRHDHPHIDTSERHDIGAGERDCITIGGEVTATPSGTPAAPGPAGRFILAFVF